MFQLKTLNIEITSFCSLKCPICFFNEVKEEYLDRALFAKIIGEAKELGADRILLSGGEPMEHPDLFCFIELVRKKGMKAVISSSGIKINEQAAGLLKAAGLECCYISVCGSKPEIHNRYRQDLELALEAMNNLAKAKQDFRLNWIACSENIDDLPAVIRLARKMGAKGIDILCRKPSKKEFADKLLDEEGLDKLARMINPHIRNGYAVVEGCFDVFKFKSEQFSQTGMATGCIAGRYFAVVKTDGRFAPCTHLFEYAETAESLTGYWNHSAILKKFRTKVENPALNCSRCARKNQCSPCRVISYCPLFTPRRNPPQFASIYEFTNNQTILGGKK